MKNSKTNFAYFLSTYFLCIIAALSLSALLKPWHIILFGAVCAWGLFSSFHLEDLKKEKIKFLIGIFLLVVFILFFAKFNLQRSSLSYLMIVFLFVIALSSFILKNTHQMNILHFECLFLVIFSTCLPFPMASKTRFFILFFTLFLMIFILQLTRGSQGADDTEYLISNFNISRCFFTSVVFSLIIASLALPLINLIPKFSLKIDLKRRGSSLVDFRSDSLNKLNLVLPLKGSDREIEEDQVVSYVHSLIFSEKSKEIKHDDQFIRKQIWSVKKKKNNFDQFESVPKNAVNDFETKKGTGLGSKFGKKDASAESSIGSASGEIKKLNKKIQILKADLAKNKTLYKIMSNLRDEDPQNEKKIMALQTKIKKLGSQINELESKLKQIAKSKPKDSLKESDDGMGMAGEHRKNNALIAKLKNFFTKGSGLDSNEKKDLDQRNAINGSKESNDDVGKGKEGTGEGEGEGQEGTGEGEGEGQEGTGEGKGEGQESTSEGEGEGQESTSEGEGEGQEGTGEGKGEGQESTSEGEGEGQEGTGEGKGEGQEGTSEGEGEGQEGTGEDKGEGQYSGSSLKNKNGKDSYLTSQDSGNSQGSQSGDSSQGSQEDRQGSQSGDSSQGSEEDRQGSQSGDSSQGSEEGSEGSQSGDSSQGSQEDRQGSQSGDSSQGSEESSEGSQSGDSSQGSQEGSEGSQSGDSSQGSEEGNRPGGNNAKNKSNDNSSGLAGDEMMLVNDSHGESNSSKSKDLSLDIQARESKSGKKMNSSGEGIFKKLSSHSHRYIFKFKKKVLKQDDQEPESEKLVSAPLGKFKKSGIKVTKGKKLKKEESLHKRNKNISKIKKQKTKGLSKSKLGKQHTKKGKEDKLIETTKKEDLPKKKDGEVIEKFQIKNFFSLLRFLAIAFAIYFLCVILYVSFALLKKIFNDIKIYYFSVYKPNRFVKNLYKNMRLIFVKTGEEEKLDLTPKEVAEEATRAKKDFIKDEVLTLTNDFNKVRYGDKDLNLKEIESVIIAYKKMKYKILKRELFKNKFFLWLSMFSLLRKAKKQKNNYEN